MTTKAKLSREERTRVKRAREAAEQMARVAAYSREIVDKFDEYVADWRSCVEQMEDGELDSLTLAEPYVIERALEKLDELLHVHTGSTHAMHYRQARHELVRLAAPAGE